MIFPPSLAQAKQQLKIPESFLDEDGDVQTKLEIASGIILDYLKLPEAPAAWASVAPAPVVGAVLLVLDTLYNEPGSTADPITAGVKSLLHRRRYPAIA